MSDSAHAVGAPLGVTSDGLYVTTSVTFWVVTVSPLVLSDPPLEEQPVATTIKEIATNKHNTCFFMKNSLVIKVSQGLLPIKGNNSKKTIDNPPIPCYSPLLSIMLIRAGGMPWMRNWGMKRSLSGLP
jgi:hypothetical protein